MAFVKEQFPVFKPVPLPAPQETTEEANESELFKTERPAGAQFTSSATADLLARHGYDVFSLSLELADRHGSEFLTFPKGDVWQPFNDVEKTIKKRAKEANMAEEELYTAQRNWCRDNEACPWYIFMRLYNKGELQCQKDERGWTKQRSR
jgi:hypothetical protein